MDRGADIRRPPCLHSPRREVRLRRMSRPGALLNGLRPAMAILSARPRRVARDKLLRLTDHPDSRTRRRAVGEIARRGAAEHLMRLLDHRYSDVRASVPLAALQMGPAGHALIPPLVEGWNSDDPEVSRATLHSLRILAVRYGAHREPTERVAGRVDADSH